MSLLKVENLHAVLKESMEEILKGVNVKVNSGEIHAIMGPNGSGKSTFAHVLMGNPKFKVTSGSITLDGVDLGDLSTDERAKQGMFMTFQHPQEIPGIRLRSFLIAASGELGNMESPIMKSRKIDRLSIDNSFDKDLVDRYLNVGFSGGEKKKSEIVQMQFLKPKLVVLDEIDSGLDVDALKVISKSINSFRSERNGIILITHYERLLEYVVPDYVHVYVDGSVVASGGPDLAREIQQSGYERYAVSLREV